MMGRLLGFLGLLGLLGASVVAPALARAEESAKTDSEVWNEGVTYFEGGDATNALRVLRPLMLSKTHGARAAEVVAALEHARGNRTEAAVAAQIALRAKPDDPKANRNYTRATDGLAEAREAERINAVLKAAEGQDPGSLLAAATRDARTLMTAAGCYRTNRAVRAVALADRLSAQARKLADTWLPVREAIANAVTNAEQAATIVAQVEAAQAKTKKASEELSDLSADAYGTLSDVEHDFTRFLKLTAMPPAALAEDLVAQSNAWLDVEAFNGRSWQQDALDYTRAFRAKFPAWARAYEQQAQSDTNMPPFSAEDQAKVSALATQLEKLQLDQAGTNALEVIRQIQELLPKNKNGGGGQNQQQNQQQQQNQNQDQSTANDSQSTANDSQSTADDSQSNDDQQQSDEQKSEPQEPTQEDKEVEAVLKRAQERNDEHEAEKRARMRKAPLPPNARDW